MSENPEQYHPSTLEIPLQQFLENDPTLRLNRVALMLNSTQVSLNESSWVSSNRREEGGENVISIGTKELPEEVATRWGVGTGDKTEQLLVKLSHELAHSFQLERGFEGTLVRFLNGDNNISKDHLPYVELYAILSGIGPINGLTTEPIYAEQSVQTGNLKMETLEDITELISAYMISDEYFTSRLENSISSLSGEQKEQIAIKVIEVCRELH